MITLTKDRKSPMWILEVTDCEGFHHCIFVSTFDLSELRRLMDDNEIPYF